MATIHEYENWLDEIERRIIISEGAIRASFKKQYLIPLETCNTPKKALCQAQAFSAHLLSNDEDLPWDSLALHMLRLAGKAHQFSIDVENLYRGSRIRLAGDFENPITSITGDDSIQMEFRGAGPNYFRLTITVATGKTERTLKLHKLHCFTSSMYEFAEIISLGLVLTSRHIILCLPDRFEWSLYDGCELKPSGWYGQDSTRLALGIKDRNTLKSAHSELCKFLGEGILLEPSWYVNFEQQVL